MMTGLAPLTCWVPKSIPIMHEALTLPQYMLHQSCPHSCPGRCPQSWSHSADNVHPGPYPEGVIGSWQAGH